MNLHEMNKEDEEKMVRLTALLEASIAQKHIVLMMTDNFINKDNVDEFKDILRAYEKKISEIKDTIDILSGCQQFSNEIHHFIFHAFIGSEQSRLKVISSLVEKMKKIEQIVEEKVH